MSASRHPLAWLFQKPPKAKNMNRASKVLDLAVKASGKALSGHAGVAAAAPRAAGPVLLLDYMKSDDVHAILQLQVPFGWEWRGSGCKTLIQRTRTRALHLHFLYQRAHPSCGPPLPPGPFYRSQEEFRREHSRFEVDRAPRELWRD